MKIRSLILFVIFLIGSCCYVSCVRDVILDAGENPQVVVECIMSNDTIQKLYLNFTKGSSRQEAEPLTEAIATLIDLTDEKPIGEFKKSTGNLWTLDYSPVSDHHYRIEVQVPGYDMIWAEETMPQRADISSYTTHFKQLDERDYNLDSLHPDTYAYFFNGTYFIFGSDRSDRSEPIWVYGLDIDEPHPDDPLSGIGPIASEIYTDIPTADNFNVKNKKYIPEVLLHLDYAGDNEIIGVDVVNYPDLAGSLTHDRFLRIDGGKAHEPFLITCNFKHWYDNVYPQIRHYGTRPMVFMSVSDAYDDYLKTALIMEEKQSSSDMSTIYLRDNLPSNIQGGVGIFGCKYAQTLDNLVQHTFIPIEEYSKYGIDPETHEYIKD